MARLLTAKTRAAEIAVQGVLQRRIAQRVDSQLRREIARAMLSMADAMLTNGDIGAEVLRHREAIDALLTSTWTVSMETFGGRLLQSFDPKSYRAMQTKRDVPRVEQFGQSVSAWVRANGSQKVTQISGTTEDQAMQIINSVIAESVVENYGERETAAAVRSAIINQGGALSSFRSRMIARTETHNASQAGIHSAAIALEFPVRKEWISAQGDRTRDDHREADGQRRPITEYFDVGGEALLYPGDPSGSAGNVINCRCVEGVVLD